MDKARRDKTRSKKQGLPASSTRISSRDKAEARTGAILGLATSAFTRRSREVQAIRLTVMKAGVRDSPRASLATLDSRTVARVPETGVALDSTSDAEATTRAD